VSAIAGFAWHDGRAALRSELEVMLGAIAHRGTDGSGAWVDGPVALGHQMRWSTPESLGERLPLVMNEGNIALTGDARIDNRDELFAALSVPFPERASMPDSALIALAYQKWGDGCAEHLIGDFAFVLWDARARCLVCVVDALGSVPLYYARPAGRFAFASEVKALHALPGVPRRLDEARFAERGVIGLFALEKEATFFEGIRLVPPGHTLTVRPEGVRLRCYWDPATVPPPNYRTEGDFVDAMRERFTEAVRCRLRSAYPVASLLSGGLDSSSIALVAARELAASNRRLLTISSVLPLDHDGPERDERPFIEAVTQRIDGDWVGVEPRVDLFDTLADEFFWNEQPSGPRHDIYQGLFAAARDRGARVLLDGQSGELGMTASGNPYLPRLFREGQWLRLAREIRAGSAAYGASKLRFTYGRVVHPLLTRRSVRSDFADAAILQSPLTPELMTRYGLHERLSHEGTERARREVGPFREQRIFHAKRLQRPQVATPNAFGLRTAFPFRDQRVIAMALHLPESLTRYRGHSRGLVRRALDGVLPPMVQWRRDTMPFSPDYFSRLRAARDRMRDELEAVRADDPIQAYLDIGKMRSTLAAFSAAPDWTPGASGLAGDPATMLLDNGFVLLRFARWCKVC
jgi:asparagine synthase (glutamine-hydrolysing)